MLTTRSRLVAPLLGAVLSLAASAELASAAGPASPDRPAPAVPTTTRVVYAGKLQDASGRPIAGIYPLTFAFYKTPKAGRALWSEAHYVAVDNGAYAVALGDAQPLPKGVNPDTLFIGVAVTGGKEIVREKFQAASVEVGAVLVAPPDVHVVTPPSNVPGVAPSKVTQSYADLAGRALEAQTAEKLGTLTEDDVRKLARAASGEGSASKVKIGATKRFTDNAGGTGGQPYTLMCPPGHVAVGIRGNGAAYIDSISVICSPLE